MNCRHCIPLSLGVITAVAVADVACSQSAGDEPLGSDIMRGNLYVADGNVVRWFDMETGEPAGSVTIEGAGRLNDIEVASDARSMHRRPWVPTPRAGEFAALLRSIGSGGARFGHHPGPIRARRSRRSLRRPP